MGATVAGGEGPGGGGGRGEWRRKKKRSTTSAVVEPGDRLVRIQEPVHVRKTKEEALSQDPASTSLAQSIETALHSHRRP